jgi:mannose/cellobiose epimerase-like protein (N-acyl-D-glucosamine 2-epimerase family)
MNFKAAELSILNIPELHSSSVFLSYLHEQFFTYCMLHLTDHGGGQWWGQSNNSKNKASRLLESIFLQLCTC